MSPTTSPGSTWKLTASRATTPPKATVTSRDLEGGGGPAGPRRAPAAASGRGRGSWNGSVTRCGGAGPEGGGPVGRLAQHGDGAERRQDRQPRDDVGALGHDLLEEQGAERARRADGGDHGAGHPGEAADDGVLDQQHRAEDVVLAELHVRLSQRQQRSAQGGDGGGDAEGVHLGGHDADAERGGGPLVAPHGEQPDAGPAPTQVGDDEADEDEHDEHEAAVALGVLERVEVEAERTTPRRSAGRARRR